MSTAQQIEDMVIKHTINAMRRTGQPEFIVRVVERLGGDQRRQFAREALAGYADHQDGAVAIVMGAMKAALEEEGA